MNYIVETGGQPDPALRDARRFYESLAALADRQGGARLLGDANGRMDWPRRGVYFFFEPGEERSGSGPGPRIVRVGTHALRAESQSSLWGRLSQHRGTATGGNHRGSVFRLLLGLAIQARNPSLAIETWAKGSSAPADAVEAERPLEAMVSATIARMRVQCLPINDEPGPNSLRGYIERNAIALVSAYRAPAIDPSSAQWLGRNCPNERIRRSGLWNSNHVDDDVDANFLDVFARATERNGGAHDPAIAAPKTETTRRVDRGGNAQRVIDALRQRLDLDDDELSRRAGVFPRQQINLICRRLEQQGVLRRFVGARGKIVNRLTDGSKHDQPQPKSTLVVGPSLLGGRAVRRDEGNESIVPRIDDSAVPTLVVIPCSGRKVVGTLQGEVRETLLDALPRELAITLTAARHALAARAGLDETTLMPAWLRNAGTLYQTAFAAGRDATQPQFHLLILSGAYGVVRATDPIGTYNLAMSAVLWPRRLLTQVIEAYARRYELRRAVALVSDTTDYAKIVRRIDWARAGIADAVLLSPEATGGAMVKTPRAIGEAIRVLRTADLSTSWRSSDGLGMIVQRLAGRQPSHR
jgi:hypothetical protein